jgi:5-methylcytosine-specific restriction endonuclease McrBC GTP-binding regulatory subunit McrB
MKILPKFHGNRKKLEKPLKEVLKTCLADGIINVDGLDDRKVIELLENWDSMKEEFRFKHTAKKLLRMLRQLYEIGFASFS